MMQLNKDERLENMYFLIQPANEGSVEWMI